MKDNTAFKLLLENDISFTNYMQASLKSNGFVWYGHINAMVTSRLLCVHLKADKILLDRKLLKNTSYFAARQ